MKKFTAVILCVLMALPLMACGGKENPAQPTPEPTVQPTETQKPADAPTDEPADAPTDKPADAPSNDPLSYDFNTDTLEYSDAYVSFTLPEGFSVLKDTTSEYVNVYQRFFNFTNPDPAFQGSSINYNVTGSAQGGEGESLSTVKQEDLEKLFKEQFEQAFQSEVEIKTVSFNFNTLADCPVIVYEYTVTVSGVELDQIAVMIEEGNMSAAISYTFTDGNWDVYRASVNTVIPKGL